MGRGDNTPAALLAAFREVIAPPDAEDGLSFDPATLRADSIQRGEEYLGIRIRLVASLAKARIPVQIDVGYGDAVSPPPQIAECPSLLGQYPGRDLATVAMLAIGQGPAKHGRGPRPSS